ncbi:hypothetical protein FKM82_030624 [Ascaphus truei]
MLCNCNHLHQWCSTPVLNTLQQEALLTLGSVIDIPRLREAIKDAIAAVLPKVDNAFIYLLDAEGRLMCDDPPHELPQEGKLSWLLC